MRTPLKLSLLLSLHLVCAPGCSLLINKCGVHGSPPGTREQVHARFGKPRNSSTIELKHAKTSEIRQFPVEHHRVHRKFAPKHGPGYYPAPLVFWEVIATPVSLLAASLEVLRGHEIAFIYGDDGAVVGHRYPSSFMGTPVTPDQYWFGTEWGPVDDNEPRRNSPNF
jgi:hypothetical protein